MKNKDLSHFLVILIALLVSIAANAEPAQKVEGLTDAQKTHLAELQFFYDRKVTSALRSIRTSSQKELTNQALQGIPESDRKLKTCEDQYSSVLSSRDDTGDIYIFIGLGYFNGRLSVTEDITIFNKVREQLRTTCQGELSRPSNPNETPREITPPLHQLCGFDKDSEIFQAANRTRLRKKITLPSGQEKQIILDIVTSSVTDNDYDNRHALRTEQEEKSLSASREFYSALGTRNVVLYVGHSRDGGGPDFSLPVLKPRFEDQRAIDVKDPVEYTDYRSSKEQIGKIVTALNSDNVRIKPGLIGIFSCDSADHFFNTLNPHLDLSTRLILTTRVSDMLFPSFLISLNAVLSLQCEDEMQTLLKNYYSDVFHP